MIRKLVLFGRFALLVLVAAGISGYLVVPGSDEISVHLLGALLAFGSLGLVFLCVALYLVGMGRLFRKVGAERSLDASWLVEHRRLARPGIGWALAGLAVVLMAALSGYPTHLGLWQPWGHHALSYVALVVSAVALWRLGPLVRDEEWLVRELDEALGGSAAGPVVGRR